ncbi:MAG TPA: 2-oxo-4-hydroxy-4-carboxy-5-ureidoimidazoline decarboxylase [Leucothrix sp.]|nr:2-oxo-4-hydroxy-4-carboxy-5-ureidoimidazoline decarboxylase [Leucothrix sp.]
MSSKAKISKKRGGWVLKEFNTLNSAQAIDKLMQCNTSEHWCDQMEQARPFSDFANLQETADKLWKKSSEEDLLQAFDGHPEIGDVSTLREKYKNTASSAGHEQSAVNAASDKTLSALAKGNQDYKEKFGFIFIVCASGKTADEMLELLLERLPNSRERELINAGEEQRKITQIRLEKLLGSPPP